MIQQIAKQYWKRMADRKPRNIPGPLLLKHPIHSPLFDSVTQPIQSWCRDTTHWKHMLHYVLTIHTNIQVDVYLYIAHGPKRNISKMITYIAWWLEIIMGETPSCCKKPFRIFLYLSPFTKIIPLQGESIEEIHVNSGLTIPCQCNDRLNQDVVVYRWEEWFKVMIHESIHCLGLDDSPDRLWDQPLGKVIQELMGIQRTNEMGIQRTNEMGIQRTNEMGVYEAYTETWAEIVTMLFRTYEHTKNRLRLLKHFINVEIQHSEENVKKIENYTCNPLIKIHSYYILKTHILKHINEFMLHCKNVNGKKTPMRKNRSVKAKKMYESWWRTTLSLTKKKMPMKPKTIDNRLRMTSEIYEISF